MDNHERRARYVAQRHGISREAAGEALRSAYGKGEGHVAALLTGRQARRCRLKRAGAGAHRHRQRERRRQISARLAWLYGALGGASDGRA